jgi:hypothetical protein
MFTYGNTWCIERGGSAAGLKRLLFDYRAISGKTRLRVSGAAAVRLEPVLCYMECMLNQCSFWINNLPNNRIIYTQIPASFL